MDPTLAQAWESFGALCAGFYAAGAEAERRLVDEWFGALSRTSSAELNVGGLNPRASGEAASDLVQFLGPGQPGIVFTSEHLAPAPRRVLAEAGFAAGQTSEPLMRCRDRPAVAASGFEVAHCETDDELEIALRLTSEAHTVDVELLAASIGEAARAGAAEVSLARQGGSVDPVHAWE